MSDDIRAALIAAMVSLVVTWLTVRAQRKELERSIQNQFTDKLYLLRIEHYPIAFNLTEEIQHRPDPQKIVDRKELQRINRELFSWKSGVTSLIISEHSLKCFYDLRDALEMGYGENQMFTKDQVNRIFSARDKFRKSLREDIGLLYKEDKIS